MWMTLRSVDGREVGWPQRGRFFILAAFETKHGWASILLLGLRAPDSDSPTW